MPNIYSDNKGSILLYTLLITSFLILFFISFQSEIENKLKGVQGLERTTMNISATQDSKTLLKNNPTTVLSQDSDNILSLVSITQNGSIFTGLIKDTDSFEYQITNTGTANAIQITITEGGPVRYFLATFNSGAESTPLLLSSALVTDNITISLAGARQESILVLEGLGGYVKYSLDVSTATVIPQTSSYKQIRNINGYLKTIGIYDIHNFAPKTRSLFPYAEMGMYLKE